MLTLSAPQVESLWDELLPLEARELPEDLARLDGLLARPGAVGADRARTGGGRRAARPLGGGSWPADDRDGELCAVDGGQAALGLGLRDAGARGLGLAASAALLPDRARRAGAGRVDDAQARPPARSRDGRGADPRGDRQGAAGSGGSARARCGSTRRWSRPTSATRPTRGWPPTGRGRWRARAAARRAGSGATSRGCATARARWGAAARDLAHARRAAPARPRREVLELTGRGRRAGRALGARGAPPGRRRGPRRAAAARGPSCARPRGSSELAERCEKVAEQITRASRASRSPTGWSRSPTPTRGRSARASSASRPSSATSPRSPRSPRTPAAARAG